MNLPAFLMPALFVMVAAAAQQPAEPADFAFRYEFKPCQTITLNTYTNTFTRLDNEPLITIPLKLSPQQIAAVYQEILNIRFFDYATDYKRVVPGPRGEVSMKTPSTSYRLEVRSGGMIHTVTYDDCCGPRSEEANRLLSLFNIINGFINDDPIVKSLPTPRIACE